MSHGRATTLALTCALAASAVLAGCGGPDGPNPFDAPSGSATSGSAGSPAVAKAVVAAEAFARLPAARIDRVATQATGGLSSLRFVGDLRESGQRTRIDLTLDSRGSCTGRLSVGGDGFQVIGQPDRYWIRPDAQFIRHQIAPKDGPGAADLLRGKWLVAPVASSPCHLDKLLGGFVATTPGDVAVTKQGRSTVLGQDTVAITETSARGTAKVFVRTSSPHYAVRVVSRGGNSGSFELSRYDQRVVAHAPPRTQVVDTTGLGGVGG